MRVPITWLREYVDLPSDAQAIADRLAMLGFPVDEIFARPAISGVVVGTITAIAKHPNADRLQVCTIDVGTQQPLTIATAATNVAAGQVIPVATIGAQLPHMKIEPRKMRGIDSEGMLCSAEELGLPAEWFEDGIMQLDASAPVGADVVALFGLADDVLDVEVTSNRVDAMSMIGLARELAASYGAPLRLPPFENPGRAGDQSPAPRVTIETTGCERFVAQTFTGVTVAPAPAWMRIRLALAGQRPINNLVDVSNYVMLETAQPLHFYDADGVAGLHLFVRDARTGEKLVTLDDAEHELTPQALVIADAKGPLGLAGLMGGKSSEVRAQTRAIVLESANFAGVRIRRMSMQLGFRSEASSRHEKTLAPALADIGAARAAQLLIALGASAGAPHAFGTPLASNPSIALTSRDVERILGLRLSVDRIGAHLVALGCDVRVEGDSLRVVPPAWRRDLTIAADLVEEVARMEGYENIEPIVPSIPAHEISSTAFDLEERVADVLVALGYHEVLTYSLHGPAPFEKMRRAGIEPSHQAVEVRNPLSEDQRYLRTALVPGLVAYAARLDQPVRVFEIGHVFTDDAGTIGEMPALAFGFAADLTNEPAWRDSHFLRLKGDCEALIRRVTGRVPEITRDVRSGLHPGKTGVLLIDGSEVATIGRIDPRLERAYASRLPLYFCNIYLDRLPDYVAPAYRVPAKFPSTYRDLALVLDPATPAVRVETTIATAIGGLATSVRVFDEYRGAQIAPDKKSLAVRVTMQRTDATITDEEADTAIARALAVLRDELGAVIRE